MYQCATIIKQIDVSMRQYALVCSVQILNKYIMEKNIKKKVYLILYKIINIHRSVCSQYAVSMQIKDFFILFRNILFRNILIKEKKNLKR